MGDWTRQTRHDQTNPSPVAPCRILAAACASTLPDRKRTRQPRLHVRPTRSGPPPTQKPKIVTPQPGLQNVTPLTWIKAVLSSDGKTLTVRFWGGPCMGIDHAGVNEIPAR